MRRILALLLLAALGALAVWLYPLARPLARYGALPKGLDRPLNLLVLGVSPEYSGYHKRAPERFRGLTDTLLLVRLDPGANRVVVVSIPRDVWVNLPGHGWHKINAANPLGGPELSVRAVEALTGVRVDGYVMVSLEALRRAVDALGGVRLCVERPMHYTDRAAGLRIDLEPGCQRLDGAQAEAYLRFRKDALGDIGRIQRQQAFFQALKEQILSPWGLLRLPQAVAQAEPYVRTDLDRETIGRVLGFALKRPALVSLLLPGRFGNGWAVDQALWEEARRVYFEGQEVAPASSLGRVVAVVYGPGEEERAQEAARRLRAMGFRVLFRPVDQTPGRTEVLENGPGLLARDLAEALGVPYRVSGEAVLGADLTLRLGGDGRGL
ncbi:LCP family protein [Thermus filiformis]|uniref:LytR family transcriptional regulator n=1 Tax=Thermus filiformis TaxID=276 RepID=A0A0A2WNL1_THEFI|nr:LCP family protein [Thermus filiformis]KGQ21413.2 LytR family transcriptional regulator [Thermus filiformis]